MSETLFVTEAPASASTNESAPEDSVPPASSSDQPQDPSDPESLALIASILLEEANTTRDFELATKIQLAGIEPTSNNSSSQQDKLEEEGTTHENDAILALQLQIDNINSTISKTAIVDLFTREREVLADSIRARQLGTLYEANEKKERMDHEFAQELQKRINEGRAQAAGDDDVESVLGKDRVEELLVSSDLSSSHDFSADSVTSF